MPRPKVKESLRAKAEQMFGKGKFDFIPDEEYKKAKQTTKEVDERAERYKEYQDLKEEQDAKKLEGKDISKRKKSDLEKLAKEFEV